MKKIHLIFLAILTMILLSACLNISEVEIEEAGQVEQEIILKDTIIELEDCSFRLTDYKMVASKNDITQDAFSIYEQSYK